MIVIEREDKIMTGFERFHPVVLFFYYVCVLLFAMFSVHPLILLAVLAGGVFFFGMMTPFRNLAKDLIYYFFLFLLIMLVNPLFSHNGVTILFFMNDNPVTLEAFCVGAATAAMITGVMFWCKAYQKILTTDKILYLFGKASPKLALVLSMAMRYLPLLKDQMRTIHQTQKTMGMYTQESAADRLLGNIRSFDSLLTWSLEHAVDTADAMKARGYGLRGRTNFSLFRFRREDGVVLAAMAILALCITVSFLGGQYDFSYYPAIMKIKTKVWDLLCYGLVFLFMLLPGLLEVKENIQWNYWKSKI